MSDLSITTDGVRYILNNDKIKQIARTVLESAGGICELVKLVKPG